MSRRDIILFDAVNDGFNPERFAAGVATELMWALEGLVEEE